MTRVLRVCAFCGQESEDCFVFVNDPEKRWRCLRCAVKPSGTCAVCGDDGFMYGRALGVPSVCGHCWYATVGKCAGCEQVLVLVPQGTATATHCKACFKRRSRSCAFCGVTSDRVRKWLDDPGHRQRCDGCRTKPWGDCTACGEQGFLYGTRERVPLVCGHCWNATVGACSNCGETRVLVPQSHTKPSHCIQCFEPRMRQCGSCLKSEAPIKVVASGCDPDLCSRCWNGPKMTCVVCCRPRRCRIGLRAGTPACASCIPYRPQTCSRCGRESMPYAVDETRPVCWDCHRRKGAHPSPNSIMSSYAGPEIRASILKRPRGWERACGCLDCGREEDRYLYGRCACCAVRAVFDVFTPDSAAKATLEPLREALATGPKPWAYLDWLRKHPELIIAMGAGVIPIGHSALDALPRSRTTETIRGQLVATGILPERNRYSADFETWLKERTAAIQNRPIRNLLNEYGQWRLLPKIADPRSHPNQTYSTLQLARTRTRAAEKFLSWLAEREVSLAKARQCDVDAFLELNPELRPFLEPFLNWTSNTKRSIRLKCQRIRKEQRMSAMTPDARWILIERLLHDQTIEISDRIMGCLILLYGMPLTAVLKLQRDDLVIDRFESNKAVRLKLGRAQVQLVPGLDQLVLQYIEAFSVPTRRRTIVQGPWLFPGSRAGQPLSQARAVVRLRALGLDPGPGRSRALLHLASRMEPALLAQILGITASTAVKWAEVAGRTFSGYVAREATGK